MATAIPTTDKATLTSIRLEPTGHAAEAVFEIELEKDDPFDLAVQFPIPEGLQANQVAAHAHKVLAAKINLFAKALNFQADEKAQEALGHWR